MRSTLRTDPAPLALVNSHLLDAQGIPRQDLALLLQGERILALLPYGDHRLGAVRQLDMQARLLVPGFIDVQVNGGGGVLFNDDPSVASLRAIAAAHRRFGSTALLPTLISDSREKMFAALDALDQAMTQKVPGVVGIHLEGPFLAAARHGIHQPAWLRRPAMEELAALCTPRRGVVMLTLAPEQVGLDIIRRLSEAGVIINAGHTAADYATIRAALGAGLRGFTHLYNAMTPLGSREPGVVGAAMEDPHSWCGLIVDGHHVHPASLRIAIAAKARGKSVLVSDAMPPAGTAADHFVLQGQTIRVVNGVCQNEAGTLAGSALDMATAVRNSVHLLGLPWTEAVRMASTYPAAWLGLQATHGQLCAGQRADFAVLDQGLTVRETWIGGVRYLP